MRAAPNIFYTIAEGFTPSYYMLNKNENKHGVWYSFIHEHQGYDHAKKESLELRKTIESKVPITGFRNTDSGWFTISIDPEHQVIFELTFCGYEIKNGNS